MAFGPRRPKSVTLAPFKRDPLATWSVLTLHGNDAYERSHDVRARQLYEEALLWAERLFATAIQTGDPYSAHIAPLLYTTSCNNVVDLARRQGDKQTEGMFLYRSAAQLLDVAESERAPIGLRSRCLTHLKVVSSALYRYFERNGMWDAAAGLSERTNTALFALQHAKAAAEPAPASEVQATSEVQAEAEPTSEVEAEARAEAELEPENERLVAGTRRTGH